MSLSKAVHMGIHNAKVNIPQDVLASLKFFFFSCGVILFHILFPVKRNINL